MNNNFRPVARKNGIVIQELAGEVLIYDLESHKAFCLNHTLEKVWRLCDGAHSVDKISGLVSSEFKTPVPKEWISLALGQLKKNNLLANKEHLEFPTDYASRRELIKKAGIATALLLPTIAVLKVPAAQIAGTCGDTSNDINNCGMCGIICLPGFNAAGVCNSGMCGIICNPGFADCDANTSSGCEINLTNDPMNCGACANVCPIIANCVSGMCVVPPPPTPV